jgi:hypothetical protein
LKAGVNKRTSQAIPKRRDLVGWRGGQVGARQGKGARGYSDPPDSFQSRLSRLRKGLNIPGAPV